jgi:hypothetical protein
MCTCIGCYLVQCTGNLARCLLLCRWKKWKGLLRLTTTSTIPQTLGAGAAVLPPHPLHPRHCRLPPCAAIGPWWWTAQVSGRDRPQDLLHRRLHQLWEMIRPRAALEAERCRKGVPVSLPRDSPGFSLSWRQERKTVKMMDKGGKARMRQELEARGTVSRHLTRAPDKGTVHVTSNTFKFRAFELETFSFFFNSWITFSKGIVLLEWSYQY